MGEKREKRVWPYRFFRFLGVWAVAAIAWLVSTGYFLFTLRRVKASLQFYQSLFPGRNRFFYLRCAWRQFHNFASVFAERLTLESGREIEYLSDGWEYLQKAAERGTGGIIIMSHVGNWEVAARLFRRRNMKMMLFMGTREGEGIERLQKSDLKVDRVRVAAIPEGAKSTLDGLEGLKFIRRGGFISMAGDRVGHPGQRCVPVRFLGHEVSMPEAPYRFAAISHTPLFVFFVFRTGKRKYLIRITPLKIIGRTSRSERRKAIQQAAQEYSYQLEEAVRQFPYQWYHFGNTVVHDGLKADEGTQIHR
jgi:predicted LPLAT superfamily acyltransferase